MYATSAKCLGLDCGEQAEIKGTSDTHAKGDQLIGG